MHIKIHSWEIVAELDAAFRMNDISLVFSLIHFLEKVAFPLREGDNCVLKQIED